MNDDNNSDDDIINQKLEDTSIETTEVDVNNNNNIPVDETVEKTDQNNIRQVNVGTRVINAKNIRSEKEESTNEIPSNFESGYEMRSENDGKLYRVTEYKSRKDGY